jgi:predicted nucleic acid-binding protein
VTLAPGERLVVDASVAVKWVVPEPDTTRATALRNHYLIVPDLIFAECANILWKKLRRGDLTKEQAGAAARTLETTDLVIVSAKAYVARAVAISAELDHPAYDAIYLAVAEAFGLRLVTADHRLVRKTEQGSATYRNLLLPLSDIAPSVQTGRAIAFEDLRTE